MTTMQQITTEVAEAHGLTVPQIKSRDCDRRTIRARQEAWRRCHEELGKSKMAIARFFAMNDNTVGHGIRMARERAGLANPPRRRPSKAKIGFPRPSYRGDVSVEMVDHAKRENAAMRRNMGMQA